MKCSSIDIRSIRQAIKLKNTIKQRFVLFELDGFIKSEDKNHFIKSNVFSKLPISQDIELPNVDELENRNSIQRKSGSNYIKDNMLEKEFLKIAEDVKLNEFLTILRS